MHGHFIVLTCMCALLSYFPLLFSQLWYVHCMWAMVTIWFLCDLMRVGYELNQAEERIKYMQERERIIPDFQCKFAQILKMQAENDLLLMEIRSRVVSIQRRCAHPHEMDRARSLMSNSL
jgi:hypothetical protein